MERNTVLMYNVKLTISRLFWNSTKSYSFWNSKIPFAFLNRVISMTFPFQPPSPPPLPAPPKHLLNSGNDWSLESEFLGYTKNSILFHQRSLLNYILIIKSCKLLTSSLQGISSVRHHQKIDKELVLL